MCSGSPRLNLVMQLIYVKSYSKQHTLRSICDFLSSQGGVELTGEEVADHVGLSRVTVRRYMNYLLDKGTILGRMNYETGGRPSMLYRWNG